ncbi:MAG: ferredoxin--NADP reductase [Betaproteobacteria bacterium]|nr:ferredoxin--NADP reductase [Betaproteobacteria bacterium]
MDGSRLPEDAPAPANRPTVAPHTPERILALRRWAPALVSLRTTRAAGFRFRPGHYARLGLDDANGCPVWRPFSVVSAAYDSHLEFVATLVPGGTFSSLLADVREGGPILVDRTSYGFLTIDHFAPGDDLWLLATGTGIGPFLSILRDPATWAAFRTVVVVHSVRRGAELAYRDEIAAIPREELLATAPERLRYVPVVTREVHAGALGARIPQLVDDGRLEAAAGVTLDPRRSRIMVCGNPELGRALRPRLTARGFRVNRRSAPGDLAFEQYWQPAPAPRSAA